MRWNFFPVAPGIMSNCSKKSLMSTVRLPAIVVVVRDGNDPGCSRRLHHVVVNSRLSPYTPQSVAASLAAVKRAEHAALNQSQNTQQRTPKIPNPHRFGACKRTHTHTQRITGRRRPTLTGESSASHNTFSPRAFTSRATSTQNSANRSRRPDDAGMVAPAACHHSNRCQRLWLAWY